MMRGRRLDDASATSMRSEVTRSASRRRVRWSQLHRTAEISGPVDQPRVCDCPIVKDRGWLIAEKPVEKCGDQIE
jgi:hypothetical protein